MHVSIVGSGGGGGGSNGRCCDVALAVDDDVGDCCLFEEGAAHLAVAFDAGGEEVGRGRAGGEPQGLDDVGQDADCVGRSVDDGPGEDRPVGFDGDLVGLEGCSGLVGVP